MKDPFSSAAIADAVSSYREPRQLHAIPTATPRGERSSRSFSHGKSGNEMSVVRIGEQLAPLAKCLPEGKRVQSERFTTAEVHRLVTSLDEPWTTTRVARAFEITEERARDWLRRCAAKYGWVATTGPRGGFRKRTESR